MLRMTLDGPDVVLEFIECHRNNILSIAKILDRFPGFRIRSVACEGAFSFEHEHAIADKLFHHRIHRRREWHAHRLRRALGIIAQFLVDLYRQSRFYRNTNILLLAFQFVKT